MFVYLSGLANLSNRTIRCINNYGGAPLFLEWSVKTVSYTLSSSCFAHMRETQSPGWGKLLACTSRLFISVASVESSLSKTGTGRTHPGGRIGSAEKLGEKWTNEMGLPPLSGSLWDSPALPGKSSLMIVVGEMEEEESTHQVACFCSGVLCHSFLRGGAYPSHMVELDLLHKHRPPQPPVYSHQVCSVNTCGWNSCDDIGGGQGELSRSSRSSLRHSATLQTLTAPSDLWKVKLSGNSTQIHISDLQNTHRRGNAFCRGCITPTQIKSFFKIRKAL